MPPSHAGAEACLTGWSNAQDHGWDKCRCSAAQQLHCTHRSASL